MTFPVKATTPHVKRYKTSFKKLRLALKGRTCKGLKKEGETINYRKCQML